MERRAIEEEALAAQATGQAAFEHAFAAAEYYMKAAQKASSAPERARLRHKFDSMIGLAERIKAGTRTTPPCIVRPIPAAEKAILLRGSQLHGNRFPVWTSDPELPDHRGAGLFSDEVSFTLSPRQQENLAGWRRPDELFALQAQQGEASSSKNLMHPHEESDLVQDITTDCSVVASLCAAMRRLSPGVESILPSIMFPFDHESGCPKISPTGKYVFRMHFNGCFREVVIDDKLPASKTDRTLFVVDRQNPTLIWPALMEKAYLKVRGGYDFPGSNSGTDLWVLTGWVPEQLFLQSEELDLNSAWDEVLAAYRRRDVFVTLGTGHLSRSEEESLGLVGEHDYAVLDMESQAGMRRLLVKNPWCDGLVWRSRGTSTKVDLKHDPLLSAARLQEFSAPTAKPIPTGSFWISLEDVAQNFESMYLNWNPALFAHRQDHHFTWRAPSNGLALTLAYNPQYCLRPGADGTIWILLSRHFADAELEIAKQRSGSGSLAAVSKQLGFMSIYIFDGDGRKIQLTDGFFYRGPYVDSPQTLAKFTAQKGRSYTVVMAQQDLPLPSYSFTFSFFSSVAAKVEKAEESMRHFDQVSASWSRRTAGGNASSSTYSQNPQFSIAITRATPLTLLLASSSADTPVHIDLVWAGGQRVSSIAVKDLVGTSGDYRRGCALCDVPSVDPGTYTVVCSTFEPGQLADFILRVGSMTPIVVKPVMGTSAGRLRSKMTPLLFAEGEAKRRASIWVDRLTRATIIATSRGSVHQRAATAIRVSLTYGNGPEESQLAVSGDGEFLEPTVGGLMTPEVDIEPDRLRLDRLWLVVEQMGSGERRDSIDIEILSDCPVQTGQWEVVEWLS